MVELTNSYGISTVDRNTIKKIAGKIIPAISTTTAFVTGAICVDFYKVVAGLKEIELYRSCFANLSIPLFCFTEPGPCVKYHVFDRDWSEWDSLVIKSAEAETIGDLIDLIETRFGVDVSMINFGQKLLFMGFGAPVGKWNCMDCRPHSRKSRAPLLSNGLERFAK